MSELVPLEVGTFVCGIATMLLLAIMISILKGENYGEN